jgi:DNA polymerase-3 subunit delta'
VFFRDIAGKESVKKNLTKAVDSGRIPHAQLFLGKEGSGALPMALAFASYIQCQNRTDGDSCGVCSHCIKSHKLIHPDIHFSFPVVKFGDKKRADTTSDDFLPKWREIIKTNPDMNTSDWLQHIDADNNLPNINVKECNDIMHKLNMMSFESDNKILIMWRPEYLHNEGNRLLKLIEEPTDKHIYHFGR